MHRTPFTCIILSRKPPTSFSSNLLSILPPPTSFSTSPSTSHPYLQPSLSTSTFHIPPPTSPFHLSPRTTIPHLSPIADRCRGHWPQFSRIVQDDRNNGTSLEWSMHWSVANVSPNIDVHGWIKFLHVGFGRLSQFQGDLIAGLTVGLTVLPQSLAYANIAKLPPQAS